jgi:hypothetical protein
MQLTMYRLPKATSRFHLDVTLYEAMFGDAAEVTVDFRYAFSSKQFALAPLDCCCFCTAMYRMHNCLHDACRCELDGVAVPITEHSNGRVASGSTSCHGTLTYSSARRQINVSQNCISSKYLDGKVRAAVAAGRTTSHVHGRLHLVSHRPDYRVSACIRATGWTSAW